MEFGIIDDLLFTVMLLEYHRHRTLTSLQLLFHFNLRLAPCPVMHIVCSYIPEGRILSGVRADIVALTDIPGVQAVRARQLFKATWPIAKADDIW
eukprot:scaffold26817_cov18-Prasinocladus_malaysianus.AAC.1